MRESVNLAEFQNKYQMEEHIENLHKQLLKVF